MKNNILLFLLFFIVSESNPLFAQKETNVWYFGDYAGLDFNSGFPEPLVDGMLFSKSGCASICDINGTMLFYTNGTAIWNRNHTYMENGTNLYGSESSGNSALILKQPGSFNRYYVFTLDDYIEEPHHGLNYSIVDINLDNGLGAVTSDKNIPLHSPAYDYMTVALHTDSVSYWVIVFDWFNDQFLSYLLTEDGLETEAIITNDLIDIPQIDDHYIGSLNASNDGRYIACLQWSFNNSVSVHRFDNQTGKLTDSYLVNSNIVDQLYWGMEFSPSGRFLYLFHSAQTSRIYQFDLEASLIETPWEIVGIFSDEDSYTNAGQLELGPDRKIYFARHNKDYISYIKYPDLYGPACNFVENGIELNGRICKNGLPPNLPYILFTDFLYENPCSGTPTEFTIQASNYDSIFWDFGDPASGINNYSREPNPIHIYTEAGIFEVNLTAFTNGYSDTATHQFQIYKPIADIGSDTTICSYDNLTLFNHSDDLNVLWMNEMQSNSYDVLQEGYYWVEVVQEDCYQYDTVYVEILDSPSDLALGNDTTVCIGQSVLLDIKLEDVDALWMDGTNDSIYMVIQEGLYSVFVSNECGASTDSIYISIVDCECKPQIPNAFTPNGDGINDYFNIVSNCIFSSFNLQIYNRWGAIIFESTDINNSWDGLVNNKEAIQGTYIYKLEYKISQASEVNKVKGTFTLIN